MYIVPMFWLYSFVLRMCWSYNIVTIKENNFLGSLKLEYYCFWILYHYAVFIQGRCLLTISALKCSIYWRVAFNQVNTVIFSLCFTCTYSFNITVGRFLLLFQYYIPCKIIAYLCMCTYIHIGIYNIILGSISHVYSHPVQTLLLGIIIFFFCFWYFFFYFPNKV